MALEVEDGTAKANAESYISVTDATTYHANRGNAAWSGLASDAQREQALRKATDFMLSEYRSRWAGSRLTATQALDWPRAYVPREDYYNTGTVPPDSIDSQYYYPSNIVPTEVARACAELALRSISGALAPDQTRKTVREKLGPMEVTYSEGAAQDAFYKAIEDMLAPMFRNNSSQLSLVRG